MLISDLHSQTVEKADLPDRLRWWAATVQAAGDAINRKAGRDTHPSPLAATLLEAATEIDLGQRTQTTFLGAV